MYRPHRALHSFLGSIEAGLDALHTATSTLPFTSHMDVWPSLLDYMQVRVLTSLLTC
mgnify:CR=1 FL=1